MAARTARRACASEAVASRAVRAERTREKAAAALVLSSVWGKKGCVTQ